MSRPGAWISTARTAGGPAMASRGTIASTFSIRAAGVRVRSFDATTGAMAAVPDTARHLWHPWLRVQRLIRAILEMRRDPITRPVMKATLTKALREREKIRRAGWMN